ncbi:MAG: hypothetical protein GX886_14395, partial [Comamonadaceae bacterium]|nr:hypothetical protein [Comamonadaceae bacterium]
MNHPFKDTPKGTSLFGLKGDISIFWVDTHFKDPFQGPQGIGDAAAPAVDGEWFGSARAGDRHFTQPGVGGGVSGSRGGGQALALGGVAGVVLQ